MILNTPTTSKMSFEITQNKRTGYLSKSRFDEMLLSTLQQTISGSNLDKALKISHEILSSGTSLKIANVRFKKTADYCFGPRAGP